MLSLFKWEVNAIIRSKKIRGFLLMLAILSGLIFAVAYFSDTPDGVITLMESLVVLGPLMFIIAPLIAGNFIASAFEDRLVQNQVMAGKNRWQVVFTKSILYFLVTALFVALAMAIPTIIITILRGWSQTNLPVMEKIKEVPLYLFLLIAGFSISLPLVFATRKVGPANGLGMLATFVLNMGTQQLMTKYKHIMEWTPLGQANLLMGAGSSDPLKAVLIGLAWFALMMVLSYFIFKRQELK